LKDGFGNVEGLSHQAASIPPCQGVEKGAGVCPCFASRGAEVQVEVGQQVGRVALV
jgi:hypothetical protein